MPGPVELLYTTIGGVIGAGLTQYVTHLRDRRAARAQVIERLADAEDAFAALRWASPEDESLLGASQIAQGAWSFGSSSPGGWRAAVNSQSSILRAYCWGSCREFPTRKQPDAIVARLMDAVLPGNYLAISQIASDVAADEVAEGVQRYNEQTAIAVAARTHAEVCRFFAGLDLVKPGVVHVHRWRPGGGDLGNGRDLAIYAGVGRKP
jgi:hypothetical protein